MGKAKTCYDIYLNDIKNNKPLSLKQEVELWPEIKKNNNQAIEKLLKANLRFVVKVAMAYTGQGLSLEDLISCGNEGLIIAAKKYNIENNVKFISYAVWYIRRSILHELALMSRSCTVPLNIARLIPTISKIIDNNFPTPCSIKFLVEQTGFEAHIVDRCLNVINEKNSVGLDSMISCESKYGYNNVTYSILNNYAITNGVAVEPSVIDDIHKKEMSKIVNKYLSVLDERSRDFIKMRYGISTKAPCSLTTIEKHTNVSSERVRQIIKKAENKLKKYKELRDLYGE